MRYRLSRETLVCLFLCSLLIVSCRAKNTAPLLQAQIEPLRENAAVLGSWISEQWTGDDTPYVQARKEIDVAIATGENPVMMLTQKRQRSQEDPQDPQALFQWAYSAWKAPSPTYLSKKANCKGLREAFAAISAPHTYNYARMRYLLEPEDSHFIPMGERMLTYDANDLDVKYHLVNDYEGLISITDYKDKRFDAKAYQRALQIAQDVLKTTPIQPRYYTLLASVYSSANEASHHPEEDRKNDARKAIAGYQEYLRLAPSDDEFRQQAMAIIKELQERVK